MMFHCVLKWPLCFRYVPMQLRVENVFAFARYSLSIAPRVACSCSSVNFHDVFNGEELEVSNLHWKSIKTPLWWSARTQRLCREGAREVRARGETKCKSSMFGSWTRRELLKLAFPLGSTYGEPRRLKTFRMQSNWSETERYSNIHDWLIDGVAKKTVQYYRKL